MREVATSSAMGLNQEPAVGREPVLGRDNARAAAKNPGRKQRGQGSEIRSDRRAIAF